MNYRIKPGQVLALSGLPASLARDAAISYGNGMRTPHEIHTVVAARRRLREYFAEEAERRSVTLAKIVFAFKTNQMWRLSRRADDT